MLRSGWAKVTQAGNSAAQWFIQQITYRKRVSNCIVYYPYGFHANAKVDSSLVYWTGVNCDASNKIGFAWNPNLRPDLLEGEVAVYQPGTNTLLRFLEDGTVQLDSDVAVNVTSPTVTITGDVSIDGTLDVTGAVTGSEFTAGSTVLTTHVHVGSPTAATGPVSNTGVPV